MDFSKINRIDFNNYKKDFVFVVNSKEYSVPRFFADFISRKVNDLHSLDASQKYIIVKTVNKGDFSIVINVLTQFNEKKDENKNIQDIIKNLNNAIEKNSRNGKNDGNDQCTKEFIFEIANQLEIFDLFKIFKSEFIEKIKQIKIKKEMNAISQEEEKKRKKIILKDIRFYMEILSEEWINLFEVQLNKIFDFISYYFQYVINIYVEGSIEKGDKKSNDNKEDSKEIEGIKNQINIIKKEKIEIIEKILQNPNLRIENEEQLFYFIKALSSSDGNGTIITSVIEEDENSCIYSLFEFIRFDFLGTSEMKEFIELFNFEEMNIGIWKTISQRLIKPIDNSIVLNDRTGIMQRRCDNSIFHIDYIEAKTNQFDGIFSFLRKKYGNDIISKGIIEITSSSLYANYLPASCLIDYTSPKTKAFVSYNIPNSYVLFDFKKKKISPTHYTIKSRDEDNCCHLINWRLEGSSDGKEWTTLDEHQNDLALKGVSKIGVFQTKLNQNNLTDKYRYLKLTQTGKDSSNSHYLVISAVEFFGFINSTKE